MNGRKLLEGESGKCRKAGPREQSAKTRQRGPKTLQAPLGEPVLAGVEAVEGSPLLSGGLRSVEGNRGRHSNQDGQPVAQWDHVQGGAVGRLQG